VTSLSKKSIIIKIYDIKEFDKEMLKKVMKVIEGKEELIELKKLDKDKSKKTKEKE